MRILPVHFEAARRILCKALKLERGDRIVIFHDETTDKVVEWITAAAADIGIRFNTRRITVAEQIAWSVSQGDSLSVEDAELLVGCRAVLTCLTGNADCARFRHLVVDHSVADDRKVGHMPGVNEQILAEALNVDYDRVEQICDELALILAVGRSCVLETSIVLPRGNMVKAELRLDLGGISRPSIVSSGVIPAGTWGNMPGGETFIAPNEGTANGDFILSGSFENRVLSPHEFVLLRFVDGRLTSIDGPSAVREEFDNLLQKWKLLDPLNYSNLAEVGIGINQQINTLTGSALLDEKCAGTVHIALGSNHGYGGTIKSIVHQDLVSWRPSLTINGNPVLSLGSRTYDLKTWRESIDEVTPDLDFRTGISIGRSKVVQYECMRDGSLKVRRAVSSDRMCTYTIGDELTSKSLLLLYKLFPPAGYTVDLEWLATRAASDLGWGAEKVISALTLLRRHGAIVAS